MFLRNVEFFYGDDSVFHGFLRSAFGKAFLASFLEAFLSVGAKFRIAVASGGKKNKIFFEKSLIF